MGIQKYILVPLIVLWACSAFGQELGFSINELSTRANRIQGKIIGEIYYITALDNSNFLYPGDWVDGEIELSDGDIYKNMKLRYHARADELIAYNEKSHSLYTVEKDQVKSFTLFMNGAKRKFRVCYRRGENKKGQYLEELYVGTQWFLRRTYVHEQKVNPYTDNLGIMRDVDYRFRNDYFRYSEKDGFVKMGLRRSGLLAAFPEHKKDIKKILRKNRISVVTVEDMVRVFALMDEGAFLD